MRLRNDRRGLAEPRVRRLLLEAGACEHFTANLGHGVLKLFDQGDSRLADVHRPTIPSRTAIIKHEAQATSRPANPSGTSRLTPVCRNVLFERQAGLLGFHARIV